MGVISHREMRNNSAEVLRRVAAGESLIVTNNGRPVAELSPVEHSLIERLEERGQARRARLPMSSIREVQPMPASLTTAEIITDSRGKW